jgi:hypothetical protein
MAFGERMFPEIHGVEVLSFVIRARLTPIGIGIQREVGKWSFYTRSSVAEPVF